MANRIKGITVEIDGNTTGLDKALKTVNNTIKETQSKLKDVDRLLKVDPSNTELLTQKQKALKESISATKEKLDALKTAQEQVKQQMESGDLGKDKYDALQREIIATEEELKRLAKEAAEANETLNKIDSVGKTLENVGDKMTSAGKTLTTHLTTPIVALGAAAVKTTADFDEQMSKVGAISGATGKDFDDLRAKAREMGAKTKFSATEAGQGFEYMAMAGWKTGDMLEGIEGIMNLAAASGEDLGTTSDIVTDALTAFGLSAKDSGHFADVLASASSNANTNVSMLGESFKYAAPVAGALGINAEDTSVALGLMANAGIKASQAGTSLRTGLTNLAKPTKQMQTYMDKYNIALVENDDGSINLRETMISLREKMGSLSESEQAAAASAIFGKNSMAGWLAIINASDQDFDKLTNAIDNCDGSAEQMALTMQDNLSGQITILKSALQELMIQIGDALMPTIRKIVAHIQSFVEKLQQMDEGTRNTILKIAAFAAAIGPVLLVVGKLTTGVGKAMQSIAGLGKGILTLVYQAKLGVGAGGKLASMFTTLTGPVGLVVAAIAVLVAAFIHLWNTNEEFREKVTAVWSRIKAVFSDFADGIKKRLDALGIDFSQITEAIKKIWDGFCNLLAPVFIAAFEIIASVLETVLGVLTGLFDVFAGIFTGDWGMVWTGVKEIFGSVWEGIKGILSAALNMIKGIADTVLGWFGANWESVWTSVKTFFQNVWNGISSFFTGIWNGMKTMVSTAINVVKTTISSVLTAISQTFSSIWNGIIGFVSSAWETIKTVVKVGLAVIGEIIRTAVTIITLPFQFIWENCKGIITAAWEAIKTTVSNALNAIKTTVTTVWTAVKAFISTTLTAIKTTVTTIWTAIKTAISNALDAVKQKVTTIWNAIKSFLTPLLNTLKTTFATVWNAIKTTITTVLNAVKTTVTTVMNAIKTTFVTIWNAVKTTISTVVDGIKTKVTTVWTGIKTSLSTTMNAIKTSTSSIWNGIKTSIGTVVDGIKTKVTGVFNSIKTTASTVWNNIKTAMTTPITNAKTAISNALDRIKGLFNFSWSLPKLKLPHFSWSWYDVGGIISLPRISVSWYKKAMDNPLLLNSPTIFGAMNGQLLGGGEAGSEMVIGTKTLMDTIRQAVAGLVSGEMNINYGGVTINVYSQPGQDISSLADEIEERINMNVAKRAAAFS